MGAPCPRLRHLGPGCQSDALRLRQPIGPHWHASCLPLAPARLCTTLRNCVLRCMQAVQDWQAKPTLSGVVPCSPASAGAITIQAQVGAHLRHCSQRELPAGLPIATTCPLPPHAPPPPPALHATATANNDNAGAALHMHVSANQLEPFCAVHMCSMNLYEFMMLPIGYSLYALACIIRTLCAVGCAAL